MRAGLPTPTASEQSSAGVSLYTEHYDCICIRNTQRLKRIHLPMQEMWVHLWVGMEDPLEEVMATHSSILAWRTPWTEEPGGLRFMGSLRAGHNQPQSSAIHITGQRAAVLSSMKGISELCGLHPQLMTLLRRASGVNHRALKLNTACFLCLTIHPRMF